MKTEFFQVSPLGLGCAIGIGLFVGLALSGGDPARVAGSLFIAALLAVGLHQDARTRVEDGSYDRDRFGLWQRSGDLPTRRITRADTETTIH